MFQCTKYPFKMEVLEFPNYLFLTFMLLQKSINTSKEI